MHPDQKYPLPSLSGRYQTQATAAVVHSAARAAARAATLAAAIAALAAVIAARAGTRFNNR